MSILVTGGAGYIGSHMVLALLDAGENVVVVDNLSTGFRWAVAEAATLVIGDVADQALIEEVIDRHKVEAIIHFAGSIVVPDSMVDPLGYYMNNTVKSRSLIETAVVKGVKHFIFSSTAAVYGMPAVNPVSEDASLNPISPYGASKLMTEWMLRDTTRAHEMSYIALRYFNVAGADPKGRTGQSTPEATHLIKVACQAALGARTHLDVYGSDYPTKDGTCVRDYIHVEDLAAAHLSALDHLRAGEESLTVNCGYGHGFSVRDVIGVLSSLHGRAVNVREAPRRPGDMAMIVADSRLARRRLNWKPEHDDLETIIASALAWERKRMAQPAIRS
jgi:UDP-glucose 4-epimerase